jgi:hypothetical protein
MQTSTERQGKARARGVVGGAIYTLPMKLARRVDVERQSPCAEVMTEVAEERSTQPAEDTEWDDAIGERAPSTERRRMFEMRKVQGTPSRVRWQQGRCGLDKNITPDSDKSSTRSK